MPSEKDRRGALLASTTFNGIDYVEIVTPDQLTLAVHFLNAVAVQGTLLAGTPGITGGDVKQTVEVLPVGAADWTAVDGRPVLTLHVAEPGDFSTYTLSLQSPVLDPFFASAKFSFKALCDSDIDCAPDDGYCPPLEGDIPPIDYLAKDFLSFRQALLEFSGLRYPEWQERSEADFGVMFLEALSSLADDLSYTQDRVFGEATLETATQRRSLVRLARLVDYEPRPATVARVLLRLDVTANSIPSGLTFSAPEPDGGTLVFETGDGLRDQSSYSVDPDWNALTPYYGDDSQRCLHSGANEMWIEGQGHNLKAGRQLLLDTRPLNTADQPIREIVYLAQDADQLTDEVFRRGGAAIPLTHLLFTQSLKFDHDLTLLNGQPRTLVHGNLVPATQGRRLIETFAVEQPPASAPDMPTTFFRTGANSTPDSPTPAFMFPLREAPLAWLAPAEPDPTVDDSANWPIAEVLLAERPGSASTAIRQWNWRRRLLDAEPFERAFTIDPSRYVRVARNSDATESFDYANDEGETVRFGDGVFGEIPESAAVFDLTYRFGDGAAGNVAADSITGVSGAAASLVSAVTNPFPAQGGEAMETAEQVRRRAPFAFSSRVFRIVRPEDYIAAAETLPWVQRAGSKFRWTGSWLTAFTAADPRGAQMPTIEQDTQLINLLNRRRMAGYESYAPPPQHISIDLEITVCACSDSFEGDVHEALLVALGDSRQPDGTTGFFHPDLWTFGQPLERSRLEAAIQAVNGVCGVTSVLYRRRGLMPAMADMPETVPVATDAILRVENNASEPEHGTITLHIEGGK